MSSSASSPGQDGYEAPIIEEIDTDGAPVVTAPGNSTPP